MIRLSAAQINALHDLAAAAPNGITKNRAHSIRTMRVLAQYGYATIVPGVGTWTAHATAYGIRWADRNRRTPEQHAADAVNATMRAEYRARAATYIADAKTALERLSRGDNNTRRAIEALTDINHPGRKPAKVEAVGWWLTDNNYAGLAYHIGVALREIGENCAYRAHPITQRELDRLGEFAETMTEYHRSTAATT